MFQSGNMIIIGTQFCIFTMESLNFKTISKLLKLGANYSWYNMTHAKSDTSSMLSLNHQWCGRLKHTPWQHGHELKRVCHGSTHYTVTWSCIATARTSWPNVSSRYRLGLVALKSQSRLDTITPMSRSRLGLDTPTSQSRLSLETLTSRYRLSLSTPQPLIVHCETKQWRHQHDKPAKGPTIDDTRLVTIPARFGSWFYAQY